MERAVKAGPSLFVKLVTEELCPDCPLREEFSEGEVFVSLDKTNAPVSIADFNINDNENQVWFIAKGIVRRDNVITAFNGCERAVNNGSIDPRGLSCGALSKLQGRRESNGRKEV